MVDTRQRRGRRILSPTGGLVIRRLAWALMALALLTGCAQTRLPTSPSSPPRAVGSDINPHTRDAISDNGELRLAMASWPATWNPLGVDTAGQDRGRERVLEPMTARFFTVTADGTIRHDPNWLAREPSVTTDQRTVVTFSLNPKATWNDGAPITVRDFEATVRACNGSQPDFPCATTEGWDQVESVTAGSTAQEVVVTFRQARIVAARPAPGGIGCRRGDFHHRLVDAGRKRWVLLRALHGQRLRRRLPAGHPGAEPTLVGRQTETIQDHVPLRAP